jgi:hypothetical protein
MESKRRNLSGLIRVGGVAAMFAPLTGCLLVPKTRLDDSQRVAQTLRAENAQLRDQVLVLRSENRDSSDRAVSDAERLAAQQEAITRLESSVRAYQDDRERLATAVQQIKSNLELTSFAGNARVRNAKPSGSEDVGEADIPSRDRTQRVDKTGDGDAEP